MRTTPDSLAAALDTLQQRWGSRAVHLGSGRMEAPARGRVDPVALGGAADGCVPDEGALAPVLVPVHVPVPGVGNTSPGSTSEPSGSGVVSTGFPDLDAILGPGGLVREANLTLRGGDSSGKTTLALRLVAESQRQGAIAAYLDLARSLDPLEAVARGVDLDWLIVLRSADAIEGLQLAGALLGGRTVEVLVVDLPPRLPPNGEEILRRLAARARRAGVQLVALEPSSLAPSLRGALAETAGVGLGLECRSWIRVGRDVVGQRTLVTVEKNRFGPPGRRVELEIRYVDDGARERGIARALAARERNSGEAGPRFLPGSMALVHAAR
jgi:hypothetical protein